MRARDLRRRGTGAATALLASLTVLLVLAAPAPAQNPGSEPRPIASDPASDEAEEFTGRAVTPERVKQGWRPKQNPFMAPDPNNNLHNDAYQTDTYRRIGPLGRATETTSNLFFRECASVTFDSHGRIVTVCVGLDRPVLALLDPQTLAVLASYPLPAREPSTNDPFTSFSGGGYFYLDHLDRAVVPTTDRHVLVIGQTQEKPGFELLRDYDLGELVGSGDGIISALPDWKGRIWFASVSGTVGWINPRNGKIRGEDVGERIHNSFAIDETNGVFVVSDEALHRFEVRKRKLHTVWERPYPNSGEMKPGQTQAGSGTTPSLLGKGLVAITDNSDPVRVSVYRRSAKSGGKKVCSEPIFEQGESATDQSLVVAARSIITENNHGYTGPNATVNGNTVTGGLQRIDVRRGKCRTVWRSEETAPSAVPKVSLRAGLVYTYTKPENPDGDDFWYFTALDFRSGATRFKRLSGEGFGYNNNWSPITIGPDNTAYVGVLGGLTLFRDTR